MVSLLKGVQQHPAWSPEEAAVFAAHKEFELLKLLATADKKVISMAFRMGHAAAIGQASTAKQSWSRAAPRQAPTADEAEGADGARASRRRKPGQRERKLRAASACKLQALARAFLAKRLIPAARERAAARMLAAEAAAQVAAAQATSPAPAGTWAEVARKRRNSRSPPVASSSAVVAANVGGRMVAVPSPPKAARVASPDLPSWAGPIARRAQADRRKQCAKRSPRPT